MTTIEHKTGHHLPEGSRNPFEQKSDMLVTKGIMFVVYKAGDRRLLLNLAKTQSPFTFYENRMEWRLKVEQDRIERDKKIITITNTAYMTGNVLTLGIITDDGIKDIVGFYLRDGSVQHLVRVDPVSYVEISEALKRVERERVLRSYRKTHSPQRTAQLQGLDPRRVSADIAYLKKHNLLPKPKVQTA